MVIQKLLQSEMAPESPPGLDSAGEETAAGAAVSGGASTARRAGAADWHWVPAICNVKEQNDLRLGRQRPWAPAHALQEQAGPGSWLSHHFSLGLSFPFSLMRGLGNLLRAFWLIKPNLTRG